MATESADLERLSRRGRRLGIVVFALIVSVFTVICSLQILQQVWAPAIVPSAQPCRTALRGLVEAVERARDEAALETRGERAAVQRFRRALEPEWAGRAALDVECTRDPQLARGLKLIDWLRYAEEHAVRYEAVDVAHLRRRTAKLVADLRAGRIAEP